MYRVLIIDDDKLARMGLISMVPWRECGMEVVGDVSNGMKGLEFLEQQPVDLVIVDMSMPVLSGQEFMQECQVRWPELALVCLSFHESFSYVQSALRMGALDYISKIQLEQEDCGEIFRRIARRLDERSGRAPAPQEADPGDLDALEELKKEWRQLYWVYNDNVFENLCQRTGGSIRSVRHLELLVVWILQALESAFPGFDTRFPTFPDLESGLLWLRECRERLYRDCPETASGSIPQCILAAVKLTVRRLSEPLHAEDVAASVNMSRGYFSTNFKLLTGLTFNNFLRQARVFRAKHLLADRKRSIRDVAAEVGYEDVKYFSHVFWEQTGEHCSAFRERLPSPEREES